MPLLHEVFKRNGPPTHTFVEPVRYRDILTNLKSPGRPLIIEGPSGIGKTTAIKAALAEIGNTGRPLRELSARKTADISQIALIPTSTEPTTWVVDDFHRLTESLRSALADYAKYLADEEVDHIKLVLIGISKAGQSLIEISGDIALRLDLIEFPSASDSQIEEMIGKGLSALNVSWPVTPLICRLSAGSLQLAQLLCFELCDNAGIEKTFSEERSLDVADNMPGERLYVVLDRMFHPSCKAFCCGQNFNAWGRAPYLQLLRWLGQSAGRTVDLRAALATKGNHKGFLRFILEQDHISERLSMNGELSKAMYYSHESARLTVEDPRLLFYLRRLDWNNFASECGFSCIDFPYEYDFALSFSGSMRHIAQGICDHLTKGECEVFYDHNETYQLLGGDLKGHLKPVYKTKAEFIIVILSRDYPKKAWTAFESEAFEERIKTGSVLPLYVGVQSVDFPFSFGNKIGSYSLDPKLSIDTQIQKFCEVLESKLRMQRINGTSAPPL